MNARIFRRFALVLAVLVCADVRTAGAQRSRVGFGAQVGAPGGLTARVYAQQRTAYELTGAFTSRGGVFGSLHVLHSAPIDASPLHYFAGAGAFVGFEGEGAARSEAGGLSLKVGLDYFTGPFELHFHAVPRIYVMPDVRADLGYGVGLRYFLPKARP